MAGDGSRPPAARTGGSSPAATAPVAMSPRPVSSAPRRDSRRAAHPDSGICAATTSAQERANNRPSAPCVPVARSTSTGRHHEQPLPAGRAQAQDQADEPAGQRRRAGPVGGQVKRRPPEDRLPSLRRPCSMPLGGAG
ncbi:hypothetical protein [Nonomuraea sp. SYSU D8015]|uniref:hypothetical protein n=1 Tax=Nonomuraea sp. SYSU D8015 TaxID=2593644 RepID=UPI00166055EE|nr:hypothetical protein [Nonomuraea sp. SYSU D8015]